MAAKSEHSTREAVPVTASTEIGCSPHSGVHVITDHDQNSSRVRTLCGKTLTGLLNNMHLEPGEDAARSIRCRGCLTALRDD